MRIPTPSLSYLSCQPVSQPARQTDGHAELLPREVTEEEKGRALCHSTPVAAHTGQGTTVAAAVGTVDADGDDA